MGGLVVVLVECVNLVVGGEAVETASQVLLVRPRSSPEESLERWRRLRQKEWKQGRILLVVMMVMI